MAKSGASRKRISKTSTTKKPSEKKKTAAAKPHMRREVKLFICGFLLLVLILSFYTPIFSHFGNFIRKFVLVFFGFTGYLVPIYLTIMYVQSLIKGTLKPYVKVYVCSAISLVLLSAILTINASGGDTSYLDGGILIIGASGIEGIDGGLFGALGIPFMALFGQIGSIIVIVFLIIILMAASTKFAPIIWTYAVLSRFAAFVAARYRAHREKVEARKAEEAAQKEIESIKLPPQDEDTEDADKPPRRKIAIGKNIRAALTRFLIAEDEDDFSEEKSPAPEIKIFIPNEPVKEEPDDIPFLPFDVADNIPPFTPAEEAPVEPEEPQQQIQEPIEAPPAPKKKKSRTKPLS